MRSATNLEPYEGPGLIAVSDKTPPLSAPSDAEVDYEVLKSIPKRFKINDQTSANWLVRKVVEARQYGVQVKAWAERETARAAREERTLMFLFGRQLERWAKVEIDRLHGKRKSLCLPGGTIGYRSLAAKLVIDDERSVIKWAKQHLPTAVITTESLSRSILKEHFEVTGVVPEMGAHAEPARETFFVR